MKYLNAMTLRWRMERMTKIKCDNFRCKFNLDFVCVKENISLTYYFEEQDNSGFETYMCEDAKDKGVN